MCCKGLHTCWATAVLTADACVLGPPEEFLLPALTQASKKFLGTVYPLISTKTMQASASQDAASASQNARLHKYHPQTQACKSKQSPLIRAGVNRTPQLSHQIAVPTHPTTNIMLIIIIIILDHPQSSLYRARGSRTQHSTILHAHGLACPKHSHEPTQ